MILLPVDEAFAFDYLAILCVKLDRGLDVEKDIERVEVMISHQVGNLNSIKASYQFKKLMITNERTFDAIELAHRGRISARRVQEINYERYLAKRELQEKFWRNLKITEKKTKLTAPRSKT
jgi:hypothetical protein